MERIITQFCRPVPSILIHPYSNAAKIENKWDFDKMSVRPFILYQYVCLSIYTYLPLFHQLIACLSPATFCISDWPFYLMKVNKDIKQIWRKEKFCISFHHLTDRVTDLLADFNPPEVRTPALGWGIHFHFLSHEFLGFFCIWQSTLAQCVIASHIAYSV